jgi:hypothetical protein
MPHHKRPLRAVKRTNPVARSLRSAHLRHKTIESKKLYSRKRRPHAQRSV